MLILYYELLIWVLYDPFCLFPFNLSSIWLKEQYIIRFIGLVDTNDIYKQQKQKISLVSHLRKRDETKCIEKMFSLVAFSGLNIWIIRL